jgi:2,3-diketo-5-methylthio-1-phosphopentane phosphatase
MALKLFVDFDGTIARNDVGNSFFRTFGGPQCDELVQDYREGRISAVECYRREAKAVGQVRLAEVEKFFGSQPIDESFKDLVGFCTQKNIELVVLSDGLTYYIDAVFHANGIHGVRRFANEATFVQDAGQSTVRLSLRFPFTDAECTRCACCKRNLLLGHSGEDDILMYVGEGFSDTCPVQYVDVVFAKADLERFCQARNIPYYSYADFRDVMVRLQKLLMNRHPFRRRRRAELKRREAFTQE